jgi:hypothetical protein
MLGTKLVNRPTSTRIEAKGACHGHQHWVSEYVDQNQNPYALDTSHKPSDTQMAALAFVLMCFLR